MGKFKPWPQGHHNRKTYSTPTMKDIKNRRRRRRSQSFWRDFKDDRNVIVDELSPIEMRRQKETRKGKKK